MRFLKLMTLAALGSIQLLAMPNWARKYGVSCTTCHTAIPALNEMGYDFRKAGFRMPSEIYQLNGQKASKDEPIKSEMSNSYTARIQARYDNNHVDTGTPAKNSSTNQMTYVETTFYPISNSFGKYFGSLVELSLLPGDPTETENAYIRFAAGKDDSWFNARIGIFHPFEGFGASDRPYSIDRPFLQTTTAKGAYFKPWGFDQAGVEASYVYKRSTISLTMFNGIFVHDEGGALIADPAQGGNPGANWNKSSSFKNYNTKDYQVFFNQILSDNGSAFSLYYYNGKIDQPKAGTAPDAFTAATSFENSFNRAAFYGTWVPMERLRLLGGYQVGKDTLVDGSTYQSKGYFGEAVVPINDRLVVGTRYDWFRPTDKLDHVDKTGITAYANMPFNDGWQMIAQYQNVSTDQGTTTPTKKENKFQIRFIWIF